MENGEWRIENGEWRINPIAAIVAIAAIISTRPLLKSTIYQLHKQIAQNNHNKTLLYQLFFVTLHRFL